MGNSFDRRSFLKGAVAVGAAAAGMAAVGCQPSSESDKAAASNSAAAQGSGEPVFGYQCTTDWLGTPPELGEAVESVDAEIVVVGGGHAGVQCALAAAQGGADVVVIEAMPEDMYWCFGEDISAYNGEFMTSHGFGGYDLGQVTAEYIRRGGGRVNPELIRKYVYNSGEMLDNLVATAPEGCEAFNLENGDCQVKCAYGMPDGSYYPVNYDGALVWAAGLQPNGRVAGYDVVGHDGTEMSQMTEIEWYCIDAAQKLGVRWLWGTTAQSLLQNDAGDVTGVLAEGPEGIVQINASKAVALCAGDFGGNPDMVWNLCDDFNELGMRGGRTPETLAGFTRDGSGIKMGCWAGGMIESHPRPAMNYEPENAGPWGSSPMLQINCQGKRFANEGMTGYMPQMILRQPLGTVAVITDANYVKSMQVAQPDLAGPNCWGQPGQERGVLDRLAQELDAAYKAGPEGAEVLGTAYLNVEMFSTVYAADTLDQLLDYLGYEGDAKAAALATVEEYNRMCKEGVDSAFGKDAREMIPVDTPPFYGSKLENDGTTGVGLVTLAGLVTDDDMNVLRADRTPIKGLYAAGNCLGHRFGPVYWTPTSGGSVGMALTHGRVLGKILSGTYVDPMAS